MFRAHRARSRVDVAWRLVAPLLSILLVLGGGWLAAEPVEAAGGGSVAAVRARQLAAESDMRRADKQIERLQKERRNHAKLLRRAKGKLERAIARRRAAEQRFETAHDRFSELRLTLARSTRVHPHPGGKQAVDKPKLRKRVRQAQAEVEQLERKLRKVERKVDKVRALKQSRQKKPTRARIAARVAERERAEDRLAAAISAMVAMSKVRAGRLGTARQAGFAKPAKGRLSQRFGCTGHHTNPRRGGCRHFHDGVDIAAPRGTQVTASAHGYVAYVGFSPYDRGARAFVVIIGHARGFETVYAHLQPSRRVRAGERVKRGQVIGRVGLTGRTTGPHVHWEVRRSGRYLDPLKAGR